MKVTQSLAAWTVALGLIVVGAPAAATARTEITAVDHWADGDTVSTARGIVRLVGIDTPEVGTCGASDATNLAEQLAPGGTQVTLIRPSGVRNLDRYGRLLRYVKANGVDVGIRQIRHGAVARYDGLDGYQTHPKQRKYRRVDGEVPNYCDGAPLQLTSTHGSYPPASANDCPSYAPIKGNRSSMIYHVPGGRYYDVTNPEECFATESDAQAAGYRRSYE